MEDSWEILAKIVVTLSALSLMLGYLFRLCNSSNDSDEVVVPEQKERLNISEPVITFVELVKSNPKRFWCKREELFSGYESFMLVDKDLKVCYRADKSTFKYINNYNAFHTYDSISYRTFKVKNVQNLDWVTDEEWQYINEHLIEGIYEKRVRRFNEIKALRKIFEEQRKKDEQRQKIKELYIKEEK